MALSIKINITDLRLSSIPINTKVADIVASGGTEPYTYSLASGDELFQINGATVVTKAVVTLDNIIPFSVTVTDSTSASATSDSYYPSMQAAMQYRFSQANYTYKITKDIDLGHGILTIPTNCILDFQRGSFINGTIYFNNAQIIAGNEKIFEDIIFGNNPTGRLNVCWFGASYKDASDNTAFFNKAFSKGMEVYIPKGTFRVNGTVTVKNSIFCEGYIQSEPSVSNTVIFDVVDNGFPSNSSRKLIIDGLHITEVGTKWTGTAIDVQRTDTTVQNCYVLAFKFGVRLRTYCTYMTNSTVRTCTTNIDVSASHNTRQTCNVAIIGCVSAHAQDLALSIGAFRANIDGAGDYYSGFGILVSGCSFDEGTVEIEKAHTVGIRDCYFERATSRDIGISINQTSQLSHNITIDDCTFINFKYGIRVWLSCPNLDVRNCNFKAIRRYAIAMRMLGGGSPINIESCRYDSDVARDILYSYYNWGGQYNLMSLVNFSYDRWYMRRGFQTIPTISSGYPINFNSVIFSSNNNQKLIGTTSLPYGNSYLNPSLIDAPATYSSNKFTFTNDSDYIKLNLNDILNVKGSFVLVIDLEMDTNVATIMNIGGASLTEGEEVTVSQRSVVLSNYQVVAGGTIRPSTSIIGFQYFDTTLGKMISWNGSKWVDNMGFTAGLTRGTTAQRPILDSTDYGYIYYDSQLGKYILWKGTVWANMDGTALA